MQVDRYLMGKYLKAADVLETGTAAQVDGTEEATFPDGTKLVLVTSYGKLVLNKSNLRTLADAFGRDSRAWIGHNVTMHREKVNYAGRMVDGIRVRCA